VGVLVRLLRAESDAIKLAAAVKILELGGKLRSDLELEARVSQLEAAVIPGSRDGARQWGT